MDKDKMKGEGKDIKGRVKRQVGEWTGNEETQAEGAAEQAEGKAQRAWGKTKEAGRDIKDKLTREEREKDVA